MSTKVPIYLKRGSRKGKKEKLRDILSSDMISPPLGDFRHTIHIGSGGQSDSFGDISFLQGKFHLLPHGGAEPAAPEPFEFARAATMAGGEVAAAPSPLLKNAISLPALGGAQALTLPSAQAPPKPPRLHLDETATAVTNLAPGDTVGLSPRVQATNLALGDTAASSSWNRALGDTAASSSRNRALGDTVASNLALGDTAASSSQNRALGDTVASNLALGDTAASSSWNWALGDTAASSSRAWALGDTAASKLALGDTAASPPRVQATNLPVGDTAASPSRSRALGDTAASPPCARALGDTAASPPCARALGDTAASPSRSRALGDTAASSSRNRALGDTTASNLALGDTAASSSWNRALGDTAAYSSQSRALGDTAASPPCARATNGEASPLASHAGSLLSLHVDLGPSILDEVLQVMERHQAERGARPEILT